MGTRAGDKRVAEVVAYALENGDALACADFGVTAETLARYRRLHKNANPQYTASATLKKIESLYSEKELQAIAKGGRVLAGLPKVPIVDFCGNCVSFVHFTDTHMGSIYYREEHFESMLRECDREKVDFGVFTGDAVHGMNPKIADLIYECPYLGYERQKEYAIQQFSRFGRPLKMIDGNHDRWFWKSGGALIVKDIAAAVPEAEYLGMDEGDISLGGQVTLKLWHGEDGNSYAVSYRLQKIAEAFTGGEKPHIFCGGHTHKSGYFFPRMIHMVSGGALSIQSRWMRSKRIGNDAGFWIVKAWIGDHTVAKLQPTFYPLYA